ncbi:ferredoxin [Goodfellowiella coeruleoviolacea]|uniref:Ferredoxin n=1 Tax=Goodfellowiella coeruleoviolacea TaxID=334858 RepID=A0AAE3KFM8_9PSEU|nr:ferredoxin [Goodfellowiella coeruleoviolacea]MCP2165125.1 ferredoxin [Goodfellowiella coeruleoviolacea]
MTEGRWRVEVDGATCIGSGLCVGTAPDHFELVKDTSHPINELVEPAEAVRDAAESCPVEAILVRNAATGEVVAPEQ